MLKTCPICKLEFDCTKKTWRYCDICSPAYRAEYRKKYRATEHWRETTRKGNNAYRKRVYWIKDSAAWRKYEDKKYCSSCKDYVDITLFTHVSKWKYLFSCDNCLVDKEYYKNNFDEVVQFWRILNACRTRNKRRLWQDTIDYDETYLHKLYIEQWKKCRATGISIKPWANWRHPTNLSIDRIDSNKPYSKDNIRLVCLWYNYMKNNSSEEVALEFIQSIKER